MLYLLLWLQTVIQLLTPALMLCLLIRLCTLTDDCSSPLWCYVSWFSCALWLATAHPCFDAMSLSLVVHSDRQFLTPFFMLISLDLAVHSDWQLLTPVLMFCFSWFGWALWQTIAHPCFDVMSLDLAVHSDWQLLIPTLMLSSTCIAAFFLLKLQQ